MDTVQTCCSILHGVKSLGSEKPLLSVKKTMDSLVGLGPSMNWETH